MQNAHTFHMYSMVYVGVVYLTASVGVLPRVPTSSRGPPCDSEKGKSESREYSMYGVCLQAKYVHVSRSNVLYRFVVYTPNYTNVDTQNIIHAARHQQQHKFCCYAI